VSGVDRAEGTSRRSGGTSDSLCHSDLILELNEKEKEGEQNALLHITTSS